MPSTVVANRINAAALAAERGIRIQEDKKEFTAGGAGSVLKLVLHSSDGDTSASATVLHGTSPRLLTYDGIDIEAPLKGPSSPSATTTFPASSAASAPSSASTRSTSPTSRWAGPTIPPAR